MKPVTSQQGFLNSTVSSPFHVIAKNLQPLIGYLSLILLPDERCPRLVSFQSIPIVSLRHSQLPYQHLCCVGVTSWSSLPEIDPTAKNNAQKMMYRNTNLKKTEVMSCSTQGCQVQVNKKCQTTCKKMPNRFKKCQTSWNRLNPVGFDITRWVIWQKHSGARKQGAN